MVQKSKPRAENKKPLSILDHHIKTLEALEGKASKKTARALFDLQRGLTGERVLAGQGYMDNARLLDAYVAYYFPVSYQQISHAAKHICTKKSEVNILDFGCGPGAASAAIIDKIRSGNPECKISLALIDASESALKTAVAFFKAEYKNIKVKAIKSNFEKESVVDALKKAEISERFDIGVSCHLFNELWKDKSDKIERRTAFAESALSALKDDGEMILCEPSLLETSRDLIAVRDKIVEHGFFVKAPCPSCHACPALKAGENHTCHAEYPVEDAGSIAYLAKKAKLDRTSVKMTYFVFSKSEAKHEENAETDAKSLKAIVVSDAMLNKAGRIRFILCDGEKRIAVSAKKDDERAKKIGFFDLKRMDFVQFSNLEERGEAFGIKSESTLTHF